MPLSVNVLVLMVMPPAVVLTTDPEFSVMLVAPRLSPPGTVIVVFAARFKLFAANETEDPEPRLKVLVAFILISPELCKNMVEFEPVLNVRLALKFIVPTEE